MAKRKVLYICHNHPSVRPGGAEAYALELYEAMRASAEFEPIFLAKGGPPLSDMRRPHTGTLLGPVNDDGNQYFFYNDAAKFDKFYETSRDKDAYTRYFHEFLEAYQPDVVHFQHTLFLGYDLLRQVRNTLPRAAIVYTLHEFLPICHRNGQMVRSRGQELCRESSPRACHDCFPEITPQSFFMRKRFIQSHLALVDVFLAPSRFLMERYVEWGLPRNKLRYEEYGRHRACPPAGTVNGRPRNRFGFFGQFTSFKGLEVLLKAVKALEEARAGLATVDIRVWLHGANLDLQPGTYQNEVRELLEITRQNVTMVGRYDRADLPGLMANIDWVVVPSIWWENSPLVIQEAFQHGKPVICSGIGGMAEKVTHGVNGLHFRVGDPADLAQALRHAVTTPGLWDTLHKGIPKIHTMEDHVATLTKLYRELLERVPRG